MTKPHRYIGLATDADFLCGESGLAAPITVHDEIDRFLQTGRHDAQSGAWLGDFMSRERAAKIDLRKALIGEVLKRSAGREPGSCPSSIDFIALTRQKVGPMVRGLFPKCEQELMLNVLETSVVFITSENVCQVIEKADWLHTGWTIANLYLGSIGAQLLGPDAPSIVGLSEETTCYLTTGYWTNRDRFADFLVHEAAHVFHNCRSASTKMRQPVW